MCVCTCFVLGGNVHDGSCKGKKKLSSELDLALHAGITLYPEEQVLLTPEAFL